MMVTRHTESANDFLAQNDILAVTVQLGKWHPLRDNPNRWSGSWVAYLTDAMGARHIWRGVETSNVEPADDILLVRTAAHTIDTDYVDLQSRDGFGCRLSVRIQITAIVEPSDLASLRSYLLSNNQQLTIQDIQHTLQTQLYDSLRSIVSRHSAQSLVGGEHDDELASVISSSLQAHWFDVGHVADIQAVSVDSTSFKQHERQQHHLKRQREHADAQADIVAARRAARDAQVQHLDAILDRLQERAKRHPGIGLRDLLANLDSTTRTDIHEVMWTSSTPRIAPQSLVVASGQSILVYDPTDWSCRTIELDDSVGALRSVQVCRDTAGRVVVAVGAARGVLIVDGQSFESLRPAYVGPGIGTEPSGGFNSVTTCGSAVVASHSELGLVRWLADDGVSERLLQSQTDQAKAVRHVQYQSGLLWVTIDDSVYALRDGDPVDVDPRDRLHARYSEVLTALTVHEDELWVGTARGRVLQGSVSADNDSDVVFQGICRPVESIVRRDDDALQRLFFTNTTSMLHGQVCGDRYGITYQAGGQTIRRADTLGNVIVAINESRDRVFCWTMTAPEQAPTTLSISQLTGRTVQDICLVPAG